ncbi:DUF3168 domain-containing protein [uncultured Bacteroides sp.]|uniref:DUF3168 domain-containing protein n=1 Tax=uncultured Bacteroides sp. TaxID=162156 RepID=UPI002AA8583D|nr:DUF3168 domain-containing protein [uncultured Bacteroides sp.]
MINKPKSKLKITTLIRSLLIAEADIMTATNGHISPLIADKGTTGTFIVYQRNAYKLQEVKQGVAGDTCEVLINVVSDDYDNSQDIAEKVLFALYGEKGENGKYTITLGDSTEDVEVNDTSIKYIQVLLFEIN